MFAFRSRTTAWLVWGMIPATIFGSVPRLGCICANGDHKLFCERYRQTSEAEPCTCCFGRPEPSARGREAPRGRAASCCDRQQGSSSSTLAVGSGRPCRTVVDRLLSWNAGSLQDLLLTRAELICALPEFQVSLAPAPRPAECRDRLQGLPPPDLVIAHRTLLI